MFQHVSPLLQDVLVIVLLPATILALYPFSFFHRFIICRHVLHTIVHGLLLRILEHNQVLEIIDGVHYLAVVDIVCFRKQIVIRVVLITFCSFLPFKPSLSLSWNFYTLQTLIAITSHEYLKPTSSLF